MFPIAASLKFQTPRNLQPGTCIQAHVYSQGTKWPWQHACVTVTDTEHWNHCGVTVLLYHSQAVVFVYIIAGPSGEDGSFYGAICFEQSLLWEHREKELCGCRCNRKSDEGGEGCAWVGGWWGGSRAALRGWQSVMNFACVSPLLHLFCCFLKCYSLGR